MASQIGTTEDVNNPAPLSFSLLIIMVKLNICVSINYILIAYFANYGSLELKTNLKETKLQNENKDYALKKSHNLVILNFLK
jgi:hypothetical protein